MAKSSSNNSKIITQQVNNVDNNLLNYDYLKLQVDNCNLKIDKLTLLVEKYILQNDKNVLNGENIISNDDNKILKDGNVINDVNNSISNVDKKLLQERIQSAISEHLIANVLNNRNKPTKDRLKLMALYLFEKESVEYSELKERYELSTVQMSRDAQSLFASGLFKNLRKSMTNLIELTEKGKELKKTIPNS